jgi:hypothetical protein
MFVPKKLNDTQIAELIMKHTNGTSISALAKEYEIGRNTVKRYLNSGAEIEQKCTTIKNETITAWLKAHTSQIQGLLDLCIDLLPDKLKEASAREIVGAYKILTETSVNNVDNKPNSNGGNSEIKDEITIEIVDNSGDDADG